MLDLKDLVCSTVIKYQSKNQYQSGDLTGHMQIAIGVDNYLECYVYAYFNIMISQSSIGLDLTSN